MESLKDREKWVKSKQIELKYALLRNENFIKVSFIIFKFYWIKFQPQQLIKCYQWVITLCISLIIFAERFFYINVLGLKVVISWV